MWWKDYTDNRPTFVKVYNAKTNINRDALTVDLEAYAWCLHWCYLYDQMIYEWSEGYGYLELITEEYKPTGYWLPKLIVTENKRPANDDILKQRVGQKYSAFHAGIDIFQNPFDNAAECPSRSDLALH